MTERIDVAIVGAGPYGLSIAAHLREAGVEHRIFGQTMENWRSRMPPGMLLKSAPWSSCLYDPKSQFPLSQYCAEAGLAYDDLRMPLPLETFVAYGDAFQRRQVPHVEAKLVRRLSREGQSFRLEFEQGADLVARRVVLAVGVHPFSHIPAAFGRLSSELLSHSSQHGPIDRFVGRDVAILGGGASASGLAALLNEKGARVTLVARDESLGFSSAPKPPTLRQKLTAPLKAVLFPESGIGRGWKLKLLADYPVTFHALTDSMRRRLGETTLGPSGHPMMKERVIGKLPLLLGRQVASATERGGKVDLDLAARDGARQTLRVDHVIAATGYRIDLARLDFLDPALAAEVRTSRTDPILSGDYETSVPGLHVTGPAAAHSFGPVSRFVFGAMHPARRLARKLASTRAVAAPVPVGAANLGAVR